METNSLKIEIIPLAKEHLEVAAVLVAARYREGRQSNPLWPDRYRNPADIVPLLDYRWDDQTGIAALRNGKICGFITSLPILPFGYPVVLIPDWCHGAEAEERVHLYRLMYGALAGQWVAKGYLKHDIYVHAHERDVLEALFATGFGRSGIDAMRGLEPITDTKPSVTIRQAGPGDIETLMEMRKLLTSHLRTTPILAYLPDSAVEAGREAFRHQLEDEKYAVFLACEGGEAVGVMRAGPPSLDEFKMPVFDEKTCAISMAFTREDRRQTGVAGALLNRVLAWAREKGCARCTVDFESANVPGARFWLSRFEPVCYHLVRFIDSRVYTQMKDKT